MLTAEGTLLGRWTRAHPSGGFDLLGTDDPEKLTALAYRWGDLMDLECVPCSRRSRAVRSAAKRDEVITSSARDGCGNAAGAICF